MLVGILFICLIATIVFSVISINNLHLYSKYQQIKLEAKAFSLIIQCHIDQIISREVTNLYQNPSWTTIESKFLISIIHPLNKTKRIFEETSVPVSLYNTVVSRLFFQILIFFFRY
jgi:hypothetical protein